MLPCSRRYTVALRRPGTSRAGLAALLRNLGTKTGTTARPKKEGTILCYNAEGDSIRWNVYKGLQGNVEAALPIPPESARRQKENRVAQGSVLYASAKVRPKSVIASNHQIILHLKNIWHAFGAQSGEIFVRLVIDDAFERHMPTFYEDVNGRHR